MKTDETKVPEFLKGSNVDEKGLPLRLDLPGEVRRKDEPYRIGKGFKLRYDFREGVVIEPTC